MCAMAETISVLKLENLPLYVWYCLRTICLPQINLSEKFQVLNMMYYILGNYLNSWNKDTLQKYRLKCTRVIHLVAMEFHGYNPKQIVGQQSIEHLPDTHHALKLQRKRDLGTF